MAEPTRFAFAGNRRLAVRVLDHLLDRGDRPAALMIPDSATDNVAQELRDRCSYLADDLVFLGPRFRDAPSRTALRGLGLDLIVSIHFPYLFEPADLAIPERGVVNLHPAYLPWNRGWHTPTWAILDGTPAGVTLHYVDEGVDSGDIIARRRLTVEPDDTAHSLYQRLLDAEFELFCDAWPALAGGTADRLPQRADEGTSHRRRDLDESGVRHLDLDANERIGSVIDRLRALTTSNRSEAAFFELDGQRYAVRVEIEGVDTD